LSEALLRVESLKVHYPVRRGALLSKTVGVVRAVDGVDFEIARGETLGLVGESGCGKSSVGRALLGIEGVAGGHIRFAGDEIGALGRSARRPLTRRKQMVFQGSYASLDPRMRVGVLIAEPLAIHRTDGASARRKRVEELLDLVGLPASYSRLYAHQLSGGQRQRVGIARALALSPDFVVCDEPVSALDVSIQAQIINLLRCATWATAARRLASGSHSGKGHRIEELARRWPRRVRAYGCYRIKSARR
jgi:ABC-type glutathione transport system ATPase component